MNALPIQPTERDRERFEAQMKSKFASWGFNFERLIYDSDGVLPPEYDDADTNLSFNIWWAVERERQLLQNLNQSQGCKLTELLARAEKAEAELEAERKRLDWALKKQGYYARNPDRLWVDVGTGNHKWFAVNDDNPRATIDELIAGEKK